jgi:hypothetical protein
MISLSKTHKRAVLTKYIAMEERYGIVWAQVISATSIMGIGHFMQTRPHESTWVETMTKRFLWIKRKSERRDEE